MKKIFLFLIMAMAFSSYAQEIVSKKVLKYTAVVEEGDKVLQVKMSYGSADIQNLWQLKALKYELIKRVDLVYTTYKSEASFDQYELNKQRLDRLKTVFPELFSNKMTQYREVGVTNCHSSTEGESLFHGFYIIYRPKATKEVVEKQIKKLLELIDESEEEEINNVAIAEPTVESYDVSEVVIYEEKTPVYSDFSDRKRKRRKGKK